MTKKEKTEPFVEEGLLSNPVLDRVPSAGCDEVGRGPLAGPVVAACVFLDLSQIPSREVVMEQLTLLRSMGINDSKKLSSLQRKELLQELGISVTALRCAQKLQISSFKNLKLEFALAEIPHDWIDRNNILRASLTAMARSFKTCLEDRTGDLNGGVLMVDGNRMPADLPNGVDARCIVKGDQKSVLIGLGSIIAKEYRDELMKKWDEKYPGYHFGKNAGYPTIHHRNAIKKLGITPIHRRSFSGVKEHLVAAE